MGGHVVLALARVLEERIAIRHEAAEEALQVPAHFGVGVFLDQERRGGVLEMQRHQAGLNLGLGNQSLDFPGELVKAAPTGPQLDFMRVLAQHWSRSTVNSPWTQLANGSNGWPSLSAVELGAPFSR